MKIIPNLIKDAKDDWLVKTIASINNINPIIDRITEDDSVESFIFTNEDGNPLLTNISIVSAANFGRYVHKLGVIARKIVKELDVLDEALVLRITTKKKFEILMAPHPEFNIIVVQHARVKSRRKQTRKMMEEFTLK